MTSYYFAPVAPSVPLPVARQKKSGVLAVLVVTLFVAAALLGTLYVLADRDHDAATALLDTRMAELADVRGQVATTDTQRAVAAQRVDGLEGANAELTTCVDAVRHYLWDDLADEERDTALDAMFQLCQ
jgi:hypothetical protein